MNAHRKVSTLLAVVALLAVALAGQIAAPAPSRATPVATNAQAYTAFGRVFPDPQGCEAGERGQPGTSPWAEGNVCSTDFIQFKEMVDGFTFLETIAPEGKRPFAEFMEFQRLDEDYADVLDAASGEGLSAGLPRSDGSRLRSPLYLVKVTDERSDVPESERAHFAFALSLHGIERAGAEGGIRAAEDLVTWGSTDPDRALVPTDPARSVSVGEALRRSVIYFLMPNPDGWLRGDTTAGNAFYQRYNGNGVDLNRDWPSQGFTFRPYTPLSEPESRSYAKVLKAIRPEWTGGNDLHGQLIDRAFSFTLIGGAQRAYDKNEHAVRVMRRIWADQSARLAWSPLIKPNTAPRSCVEPGFDPSVEPSPECDKSNRVYADQWGTIWDTIDYTVTGAMGDWMDQPLGLNGLGLDNEMSLSHLSNCGTGKCYDRQVEQLHVDGNKGLIYAQVNLQLQERPVVFRQPGRVAFVVNPTRMRSAGSSAPGNPEHENLPPQDPTGGTITVPPNTPFAFTVQGPQDGVYNGGLTVNVTYTNAQGVSANSNTGVIVERRNPTEPPPGEDEWEEVNADFNQSFAYAQAGMTVNVNAPAPGEYRVRLEQQPVFGEPAPAPPPGTHNVEVTFTTALSWPDPGQLRYDVSNMDFFRDLNKLALPGFAFTPVAVDDIVNGRLDLSRFDSVVLADTVLPGFSEDGGSQATYTAADRDRYLERLAAFARDGGNLLLTDGALDALRHLPAPGGGSPLLPDSADGPLVRRTVVYAGHAGFNDTPALEEGQEDPNAESRGPTYARYDLAKEINQPGAAEGDNNRHQLAEPVPTGYAIQDPDGDDLSTHPQWLVDQLSWEAADGVTVGTATGEAPGEGDTTVEVSGVTVGELPYGRGVVRIIGSLLPMPTQEYDHPYGLGSYGVTYSGYQLFDNALQWVRPGGTWRLGGATRYETSAEVAYRHWNTVGAVVIASGESFPDALTAVPLAKALNAPILLTPHGQLDDAVYEYLLTRNPAPTRAYVIGGEAAVGPQVLADLQRLRVPAAGIRRLSGPNRFETAVAVARELAAVTGAAPTKAVVATGEAFADALAAGPVAANYAGDRAPAPLLLVGRDAIPESVAAYLQETGTTETLVAGGPAAVSDTVVGQLPGAARVAGRDRYETAVRLADRLAELRGEAITRVTVATGANFPDALVVGSPGGRDGIPTLLADPTSLSRSAATDAWLRAHGSTLREVYLAGGFAVLPPGIATAVEARTGR